MIERNGGRSGAIKAAQRGAEQRGEPVAMQARRRVNVLLYGVDSPERLEP